MPRLSKIGAAALAAFGWTGLSSVTADYLVVAGGGGGGKGGGPGDGGPGGGGAGGYRTGTTSLNTTQSYVVTVGGGGSAASGAGNVAGNSGNDSVFNTNTSTGGGGGGTGSASKTAKDGGSGGGAGYFNASPGLGNTPSTSPSQGNNGGSWTSGDHGAGGGGASAVGGNALGAGGAGTANSITGTSVTYAGGGGGGGYNIAGGAGGAGGGGAGGGNSTNGTNGTANLGGGGGAGGTSVGGGAGAAGSGGSGVVIISYVGAQQFGGGIVTSSGGNTIHTFTTSGTLSPLSTLTANFLVVAGGGGGGGFGGAGGGGGLRTSAGTSGGGASAESALTIDTNSIYLVTVGAGGTGAASRSVRGTNGTDSAFFSVSSVGGGAGGSDNSNSYSAAICDGVTGGSGGGSSYASPQVAGSGTANQGFAGAIGGVSTNIYGGSGGGAGSVGGAFTGGGAAGTGGSGVSSSISGASVGYAGGGGGSSSAASGGGTASSGGGAGGLGGAGTAGTAGLGGGGGGSWVGTGVNGGSGVVVISYAGATQLMAGGTVTISGGNVIHTFTSSGYLTPLTLVGNSLRFRSSASAYLNRTPTVSGNRRTWTFSTWIKRGTLGTFAGVFGVGVTSNGGYASVFNCIRFTDANVLSAFEYDINTATTFYRLDTTQVFRDPAAWYHIVFAFDSTQATSSNRWKLYVNGTEVTAFSSTTYPSQNYDTLINTAAKTNDIGLVTNVYLDGYMTEVRLIDGQALTPNSFGTFNQYGVWQPITYGGSYGTNGFYLKFNDATSTTTLGLDSSPQGNNWTTNNISVTAGVTYDSMTDVPTLTSATAANYCVLNPLDKASSASVLNGNLRITSASAAAMGSRGSIQIPSSGKWYYEATVVSTPSGSTPIEFGSATAAASLTGLQEVGSYGIYVSSAISYMNNGSATGNLGTLTAGDIIQFAGDCDNSRIWIGKNNAFFDASSGTTGNPSTNTNPTLSVSPALMFPLYLVYNNSLDANFGQQPFVYTPPSGFLALNTFNL